jgi:WD40 repeat protein
MNRQGAESRGVASVSGDDGPLQRMATLALLLVVVAGGVCAQRREPKRLLSRTPPPLRELRFSPDGRYLLAQGDSGVTVLTVRPFAVLFRIPADDADLAQFTPDSRQVVFVSSVAKLRLQSPTSPAHLERWNTADHTRAAFTDIPLHGCEAKELSPDGRVLACVDFSGKLRILDIPSGQTLFEKDNFAELFVSWPTFADRQVFGDTGSATLAFSPDGRFVIAMPNAAGGAAVACDLRERRPIRLEGATKGLHTQMGVETKMTFAELSSATFAFVAPDRLIISPLGKRTVVTATLVAFPSGKVLAKPTLPPGPLLRATDRGFVLIRPFGEYILADDPSPRAAAVEFGTGKVIVSNAPALDVLGNYYAAERINGEVGLYERGKGIQAAVKLE